MVAVSFEAFLHAFEILVLIFAAILGLVWLAACVFILICVVFFAVGITRVVWKAGSLSKAALVAYSKDEEAKL